MFSNLTSAQIGSAVRWTVTNVGMLLVARDVAVGLDWTGIAGAASTVAMLLWSFWSNSKKVA